MKPVLVHHITLAFLLSLSLIGCTEQYKIDMALEGDSIKRTVTIPDSILDQQRAAMTKVYGDKYVQKNGSDTYPEKVMTGTWDNGFGGTGMTRTVSCPLGTTMFYSEFMGGNIPLHADQQILMKALDLAASEIAEQLRMTSKGSPMGKALADLVEGRIHTDVKDAASVLLGFIMATNMYEHALGNKSNDDAFEKQMEAFALQAGLALFHQRGWITAEETILIAADPNGMSSYQNFPARVALRAINMDFTQANMKELEDLVEKTFTSEFGELLQKKSLELMKGHPHLVATVMVGINLLTSYDVDVMLYTGTAGKPTKSNGTWKDLDKQLSWSTGLPPWTLGILTIPVDTYAFWATPDKAEQEKLFGSVTVKDEELAMFCMAWSMSNDTARKQAMEMMQKAKSVKADSGEHVMRFLLEPSGESAK